MVSINLAARHRISNVVLRCSIFEPQNGSCMTAVRYSRVWKARTDINGLKRLGLTMTKIYKVELLMQ